MIKPIYSYGIQPGSALILLTFLGVALPLMTLCIDYAELAVGQSSESLESASSEAIVEILVLLELLIHVCCLGYGVIIKGMRTPLLAWIVCEVIFMLIWEVQLIWFLIEELTYSIGNKVQVITVILYFIVYTALYYGYELNLALQCLPLLNTITELEPIGKGLVFIVDHFKTHPRTGAMLAIMSEIMLNAHVFLERHVTEYGIGFDYLDDEIHRSTALSLEETFVRYIRVAICIIGFFLTYKEKQWWIFKWCIAYMAVLTLSLGIFLYMIFIWRAVHGILTLIYFSTFTLNLLYRTGVLYACVRYTDVYNRQGLPL